jgi:serine protease Do
MCRILSKRPLQQLALVASGTLLGLGQVIAGDEPPDKVFDTLQQSVQAVFAKCRSAVVRIEAVDWQGRLSGTGFFIDPNGTIYTSYTVGGESREIHVTFAGDRYEARRLVSDPRSGVAILKIEAETPFLPLASSRQLSVASPVIAVGYPMDYPITPAFGTVGGVDLKHQGRYFFTSHIRANISVQRGESGAPLLDSKGGVVGILISRVDTGSAAFALPIEAAEKVRKDYMRFKNVRPGWIGVHIKTLKEPVSGSTAFVEQVAPSGPAEKAGLERGDVLLQVGRQHVTCLEDMIDASFFLSAEDETIVRVARNGSEREFSVMPVDNPELTRRHLGATEPVIPVLPIIPVLKIDE